MTEQELENLPYPMFNTTWYEKLLLLLTKFVTDRIFICFKLRRLPLRTKTLQGKISVVLGKHPTLDTFIFGDCWLEDLDYDIAVKIREIWIRKLLAYKGE
jgi:hypothetical protein